MFPDCPEDKAIWHKSARAGYSLIDNYCVKRISARAGIQA